MAIFVSSGYIRRPPIFFVLETSAVSGGNQGGFVLVDGGECCNWLSFHRKMQFFLICVITHSSRLQSNRHTHTLALTAWSTYRTFACQPVSTRAHSDSNQHASFRPYPPTIIMKHIIFVLFCIPPYVHLRYLHSWNDSSNLVSCLDALLAVFQQKPFV